MTQNSASLARESSPMPFSNDESGPGRILLAIFDVLDGAGIGYCVLHGYEGFPQRTGYDVDCIIDAHTTPAQLHALLRRSRAQIGAEIVACRGYYIVLAGKDADGSACFLTLDFGRDLELDGVHLYPGREVLAGRRRYRRFWIPAVSTEFAGYLARSIGKERLDAARARRLSLLYRQDPIRSRTELARFWSVCAADLLVVAAESDDWSVVQNNLASLRRELVRRAVGRSPARFAWSKARSVVDRVKRVWRPQGLNVVLLGPDGAGKSSVVEALGPRLHGAFSRTMCSGFAPALHRLFRRGPVRTDQPHALPARSFLTSVLRAGYWLAYQSLGYPKLRLALARSTLVLNDRHFLDIFVDPKRYRYGGPLWLIRLIWSVMPKPDLIIVLDAPPEVLQARKQEVSFQETARQCGAYRLLAQNLDNCHVIDAAQSLHGVVNDISDIILRQLAMRVGRPASSFDRGSRAYS